MSTDTPLTKGKMDLSLNRGEIALLLELGSTYENWNLNVFVFFGYNPLLALMEVAATASAASDDVFIVTLEEDRIGFN